MDKEKLNKEFDNLLLLKGTPEYSLRLKELKEIYTAPEERKYLMGLLSKNLDKLQEEIKEIEVKLQLLEISKIISLSYVAEHYFGKTRQWLYQKLNGNVVHGKKYAFSNEEKETLNFALQDISKKIGSLTIV